jgi:hypothetical protein
MRVQIVNFGSEWAVRYSVGNSILSCFNEREEAIDFALRVAELASCKIELLTIDARTAAECGFLQDYAGSNEVQPKW